MSSGSESDEEYVPGEPEVVSEEDSADEETEQQYENEQEVKSQKRKGASNKQGNKRRKAKPVVEEKSEEKEVETETLNPEDEKKREDDLWAMFLDGTDTKPKPKETTATSTKEAPKTTTKPETSATKKEDDSERERRIFEFAGETIVVENNVIKEKYKPGELPADVKKLEGPPRARTSGGLSSVLGQLNKKNKLSTLDKSKLDWETLKKTEGVEDEIKSHNKGKQGYLDRQDFLQRADLRQYELERDARLSRRSNR